ncbi:hypothetical protein BGP75_11550 [Motiliproteus sp. MSK22-1]|nr:hypothetical protein BGP75_11550 [Motiliproteus sp. MSK22-1]
MSSCGRLIKQLHSAGSLPEMLDIVREEIRLTLGFDDVWAYLYRGDDRSIFELISVSGSAKNIVEQQHSIVEIAGDAWLTEIFSSEKPVYCADARIDPRTDKEKVKAVGVVTMIGRLLSLDGKKLGRLGTGSFEQMGVRPMSADEIAYFDVICDVVSITVDRLHYMSMSHQDSLTKLSNRRGFKEIAATQLSLANRKGEKVPFVYLDLDGFKPLNDTFGHNFGDKVLVEFSNKLRRVLRASSAIARIGGDEFLLTLPETADKKAITSVVNKLKQNCCDFEFDGLPVHLSFSVGYAIYPDDAMDIDQLIGIADKNMYRNKHSKR